ncbi:MAG: rhodanese-like domain-containing protein [Gammaproteobacteria bacterium]|nr:rhodanese-like domain-containing protein [Gammaproteobacteria bacterium]
MFSEFVTQNILWVGAFVLVANLLILSLIQGRIKGVAMVSPLAMPQLQRGGKWVIIDVNEASVFANAHIPDSVNYPLSKINAENTDLLKHRDKTTIVVCQNGSQSSKAAKLLLEQGFTDVHVLQGGLQGWTKENLPVASD